MLNPIFPPCSSCLQWPKEGSRRRMELPRSWRNLELADLMVWVLHVTCSLFILGYLGLYLINLSIARSSDLSFQKSIDHNRSIYLYLPEYLPSLPIRPPTYLPTYLPIYPSTYLSIYLFVYLSIYLSIYLSFYLSLSKSIYLSLSS